MTVSNTTAMSKLDEINIIGHAGEYSIYILQHPSQMKEEWQALQRQNTAYIYQNYDWVRIACDTLEATNEVCIVVGKNDSGVQFILPMVLEGDLFKSLRWIGGSHANICCGLYSKAFLKSNDKAVIEKLFNILGKSVGKVVMSKLVNQPYSLMSYQNPLLHLQHQNSVNLMYDMDLRDGLDKILDAGSGKRKRKLWRKQNRVAEEMGGFEIVVPQRKEDILEALAEFRVLKAKRFKDIGVKDVFAEQSAINFLKQSALEPMKDGIQVFRIIQLKIAGKTRAMYALGIYGSYCQAYVNAVEYDEFSEHSPGEMMMYAMVEHFINEGYEKLDMGVGDERYKRSWCPNQHDLFDTILPLSIYAKPWTAGLRVKNRVKRYIRNNPKLWLKLKKLRKAKANITSKN